MLKVLLSSYFEIYYKLLTKLPYCAIEHYNLIVLLTVMCPLTNGDENHFLFL